MISQSLSLPITTPTLGAGFLRAMTPLRGSDERCGAGTLRSDEVYHRGAVPTSPTIRGKDCRIRSARKDLSHPNASLTMLRMPAPLSPTFTRSAALLALCLSFAAFGQPTDGDFAAARDAYRAGDSARLERLAPRLKGHLLEPYVAYWQIKLKLDDADPAAVRSFLDRYADLPLADRLRSDWLKSLGKRGAWALFAAEYPKHGTEDVELACYAAQFESQPGNEGHNAAVDVRRYWFSGQEQPQSCQPLFAAMRAQGTLTSRDIWARFRLAHEAGNFRLAARIASELSP